MLVSDWPRSYQEEISAVDFQRWIINSKICLNSPLLLCSEAYSPPMAPQQLSSLLCSLLLTLTCLLFSSQCAVSGTNLKANLLLLDFTMYMGDLPEEESSVASLHVSTLQKVVGRAPMFLRWNELNSEAENRLLHSYSKSFNGFSAKLTEEEMEELSDMDGVVSVFQSQKQKLHTTRSWDYMNFPLQQNHRSKILPQAGTNSRRRHSISKGLRWPRDTHCINGSRKHCHQGELVWLGPGDSPRRGSLGPHSGIQAFEDAIADGVDIISISLGGYSAADYFSDPIAIGSFHAMKKGILTSASAGNEGPHRQTISNVAPWLVSVASGTTDRKFLTPVKLGNREVYMGFSLNTFELNRMYHLIYAGNVPNKIEGFEGSISRSWFPVKVMFHYKTKHPLTFAKWETDATCLPDSSWNCRFCANNSLDKTLTKGKIILCDLSEKTSIDTIPSSGVVGYVLQYQDSDETARAYPIPAACMQQEQGVHLLDYINSTRNPTGVIMKSIERIKPLAPIVARTSSRGPNPISPGILKESTHGC
ncbi:unnamed protein product, partial [Thlaspi arvense]